MNADLLKRLVDVAVAEVGLKELPGHPNTGPDVEKYQAATWLAPGPWPYCAAFVDWCVQRWIVAPDVRRALNIEDDNGAEIWRCKDARAFGLEVWARSKGLQVLSPDKQALAGDLIVYQFSHTGLVVADEIPGRRLATCEANTVQESLAGSQRDGDGVWMRSRPDSLTKCYIRLLPT